MFVNSSLADSKTAMTSSWVPFEKNKVQFLTHSTNIIWLWHATYFSMRQKYVNYPKRWARTRSVQSPQQNHLSKTERWLLYLLYIPVAAIVLHVVSFWYIIQNSGMDSINFCVGFSLFGCLMVIEAWLDFRADGVIRQLEFRVDGLLRQYDWLDKILDRREKASEAYMCTHLFIVGSLLVFILYRNPPLWAIRFFDRLQRMQLRPVVEFEPLQENVLIPNPVPTNRRLFRRFRRRSSGSMWPSFENDGRVALMRTYWFEKILDMWRLNTSSVHFTWTCIGCSVLMHVPMKKICRLNQNEPRSFLQHRGTLRCLMEIQIKDGTYTCGIFRGGNFGSYYDRILRCKVLSTWHANGGS